MKFNAPKISVLLFTVYFILVCQGVNLNSQIVLLPKINSFEMMQPNDLGNLSEFKDSLKTRYYEAPFNELPFGVFNIIDTAYLIVYSQEKIHRRYGSYLKYYYSLNIKSRVHELILENLQVDFADNEKFLKLVEKNENSLYKVIKGITVINKLLIESLK